MSVGFGEYHEKWLEELQRSVEELRVERKEEQMDKVMLHHHNYYRAKSDAAEKDPLNVFLSPWATTLERSLHWITGWRPTTAFHLIYTESSLLFESHIIDILHGLRTGDLGDLSPSQFRRLSDLQCQTVREENAITDELSEWQDGVTHVLLTPHHINARLFSIINKADDLRLRTLRGVLALLSTHQAIEFLIASAELLLGIRAWGLNHDRPPRI